jgi:hypothetical protein
MWYRVVCIGDIGVLLVVFLSGINEIYDFFISFFHFRQISKMIFFQNFKILLMAQTKYFIFSFLSSGMADSFQNENFHFKFQK